MKTFFSALEARIAAVDSLLCVGLDPHLQDLSGSTGQSLRDFCLRIIESTADFAAAYKPNSAFFEALGGDGILALEDVIRQVPEDIPVILDFKRGDISSTAQAYAQAAFETLKAGAVTINPYLGRDAVLPFIADPTRAAFVLCKTSNPGAREIQDLLVSGWLAERSSAGLGVPLYERIADLVREWNTNGNLGLVIGATQVDSLARIRGNDPEIWILAPGVGSQGGDLQAALEAGLRLDGSGMLIPVSRSISRADDPGREAQKIRDDINAVRTGLAARTASPKKPALTRLQQSIAAGLLEIGSIQFGEFTLKSGRTSPFYLDLRRLTAHPELMLEAARAYCSLLLPLDFDHLAALPYAGLPIASAVSLVGGWSLIYPRKELKDYGTKAQVEGVFSAGDSAVVLDDLITTGGSKLEGIQKLLEHGLQVRDIVVLVDRSQDAGKVLAGKGYRLHAFLTIGQLLGYYRETGQIDGQTLARVEDYLQAGE